MVSQSPLATSAARHRWEASARPAGGRRADCRRHSEPPATATRPAGPHPSPVSPARQSRGVCAGVLREACCSNLREKRRRDGGRDTSRRRWPLPVRAGKNAAETAVATPASVARRFRLLCSRGSPKRLRGPRTEAAGRACKSRLATRTGKTTRAAVAGRPRAKREGLSSYARRRCRNCR